MSCPTVSVPACRSSATGSAQNFEFSGYISGFDPAGIGAHDEVRAELGYRPEEKVCLVTVGGSGVGSDLLYRVIDAFPAAKQLVPELRMIVVTGPRIDPRSLPAADGLDVRGYVHDLYRHLAVCDLAVVQGGLTTTMELAGMPAPLHLRSAAPSFRAELPRPASPERSTELVTAWSTRTLRQTGSPARSPGRSGARSATAPSRPTVPRGQPPALPSSSEQSASGVGVAQYVWQPVLAS